MLASMNPAQLLSLVATSILAACALACGTRPADAATDELLVHGAMDFSGAICTNILEFRVRVLDSLEVRAGGW